MSPTIQVCPLTPALRLAAFALRLAPFQHPYVPPMEQVLARARRKADVREFAIVRARQLVGYFQLNLSPAETRHYCRDPGGCGLEAMMVDLPLQGQGIGHAALAQLPWLLATYLPDRDQVNLTVNVSNRPAQKLYRRCGFVDTGEVYDGASSGPQHVYALVLDPPPGRRQRERGNPTETQAP